MARESTAKCHDRCGPDALKQNPLTSTLRPYHLLSIACLSFALLALPGCSKKPASDSGGDQTAATSGDSAQTLESAQMTPECADEGKAAAHFATERDKGTALDEVILSIDHSSISQDVKEAQTNIARQIYHDPFASKLNPENANNNFSMACLAELQRKNSGSQTLNTKVDIDKSLSTFKTYTGATLSDLLGANGVTIQSMQVAQAKIPNNNGYKSGDIIYTLTISGDGKGLPCNLTKWVRGDIPPTPEFVQRGPAFPLLRPAEDDPLIYWAATGRCSSVNF